MQAGGDDCLGASEPALDLRGVPLRRLSGIHPRVDFHDGEQVPVQQGVDHGEGLGVAVAAPVLRLGVPADDGDERGGVAGCRWSRT